jgi:hypothetical protein
MGYNFRRSFLITPYLQVGREWGCNRGTRGAVQRSHSLGKTTSSTTPSLIWLADVEIRIDAMPGPNMSKHAPTTKFVSSASRSCGRRTQKK